MDSIPTQDPPLPVAIKLIFKDIQVFTGNDQQHVAYELLVTNAAKVPVRILAIVISGILCKRKNTVYKSIISGSDLASMFSKISTTNTDLPEDPFLQPNETGVIYLFLDFPCKVPNELNHKVILESEGQAQSIVLDPFPLNKCPPIVVSPPLKGNNWIAAGGVSDFTPHRRTIFILNGKYKLPEKTAVDFLQYGPQGLYKGDPLKKENWYSYGNKIYSPADGEVVGTVDGIPENIPTMGPTYPVTSKNIGGNYVLMKLSSAEDNFAFFAHMIPGSIRVKVGDKVCKGQVLGLLGNSGNSGAPHLHFQISNKPSPINGISDEPSPINAQGVPWYFDKFIREEYIPIGESILDTDIPKNIKVINQTIIKNQILLANNLVSF